jgi:hypothetical protein
MEDEMGRACSTHGSGGKLYETLAGQHGENRLFGRPRDNVKLDIKEIECDVVDRIQVAQDAV